VGNLVKEGTGTIVLAGINSYTGNTIIQAGTLEFAEGSELHFVAGDTTGSNRVTGRGSAIFNGTFVIDSTDVNGATTRFWQLVDVDSLTAASFGANFGISGFTADPAGVIWTMSDNRGDWTFSEATGELAFTATNYYLAWQDNNGVVGSKEDDDDQDGLSNYAEYAFGLNPTSAASFSPITSPLNPATGKISYTRRATPVTTGVSYTVWTSQDLNQWTEDTAATDSQLVTSTNGDVQTVEVTLSGNTPLNPTKLFVRVRADSAQ
jgi:autotransporter-associated beta strand protein